MVKRKIFLLSTETYGGAEKNLLKLFQKDDFLLITERMGSFSVFFQLLKLSFKSYSTIIIPLGRRNTLISLVVSTLLNKKMIYNIRATEMNRGYWHYFIDRLLISTHRIILISNSWAGVLVYSMKLGIDPNKFQLAYNLQENVNDSHSKSLYIKLVMIGHIRQEKGYDRLIDFLIKMENYNIFFEIDVYGHVDEEKQHLLEFMKHPSINYHSGKSINEIKLNNYDFLLNISYDEGLPTTFLEVGSNGLPIITVLVSGVSEYVTNGYNGVVFKWGNFNQLALMLFDYCSQSKEELRRNCTSRFKYFKKSSHSIEEIIS